MFTKRRFDTFPNRAINNCTPFLLLTAFLACFAAGWAQEPAPTTAGAPPTEPFSAAAVYSEFNHLKDNAIRQRETNGHLRDELLKLRGGRWNLLFRWLDRFQSGQYNPILDTVSNYSLMLTLIGFLGFFYWRWHDIAYLFTSDSFQRTFWLKRPTKLASPQNRIPVICMAIFMSLVLGVSIFLPILWTDIPRETPLFLSKTVEKLNLKPAESPHRTIPIVPFDTSAPQILTLSSKADEAYRQLNLFNPGDAANLIIVSPLENKLYPEFILPDQFEYGDNNRLYVLGVLAAESGMAIYIQHFKAYLHAIPSSSLIGGDLIEQIHTILEHSIRQSGVEAAVDSIPLNAKWAAQAELYLTLVQKFIPTLNKESLDALILAGMQRCESDLEQFKRLVQDYYELVEPEGHRDFWETYYLNHYNVRFRLLAGAFITSDLGYSDLSTTYTQRSLQLTRDPMSFAQICEWAWSKQFLANILKAKVEIIIAHSNDISMPVDLSQFSMADDRGALNDQAKLSIIFAAIYSKSGDKRRVLDFVRWTLLNDYMDESYYPLSEVDGHSQFSHDAFWANPQIRLSLAQSPPGHWNNMQIALNTLRDVSLIHHDALFDEVDRLIREELNGLRNHIAAMKKEEGDLNRAITSTRAYHTLNGFLRWVEMLVTLLFVVFSLWCAWIAIGAWPSFRILIFLHRFYEIYATLLCISIIGLPFGVILLMMCQIWKFITFKYDWRSAYESPQYLLFPYRGSNLPPR